MRITRTVTATFICAALLLFTGQVAHSQELRGQVTDAHTGEPMTGATVLIMDLGKREMVQLDGNFHFRQIAPGTYNVEITFANYKPFHDRITVVKASPTILKISLEPQMLELNTVTVTAADDASSNKTRLLERNADPLLNAVSSRSIQLMPDITVANVMQRISGVTIDRNNAGEGRYPVIRGMDKRYNTTLVNGIKIPSPDNQNRYVPLDMFPSELLERLEVIKSLTPDMEGDAIGGTMNLVMKDAPNHRIVQVNASGGFSTLFSSSHPFAHFDHTAINMRSPAELHGSDYVAVPGDFPTHNLQYNSRNNPLSSTLGITLGDRFGKDKKLGAVLAASYQNTYRGANSTYLFPNPQPALNNTPVFADIYLRQYSTQNTRLGLNTKLDYLIRPGQKISLYGMYIQMDEFQTRHTIDSVLAIQRTGPGSGNVNIEERSVWQRQSIFNTTLQGDHTLGRNLRFTWSGVYSIARNQVPDWASFSTLHEVKTDSTSGKISETPAQLQGMTRRWTHNTDKDLSAYVNLAWHPRVFGRASEWRAGGLIRHKDRDNYYNEYDLTPALNSDNSQQLFTTIDKAIYVFKGDAGRTGEINPNTYSSTEDIYAGYLQAKLLLTEKLEALGGVRIEHTSDKFQTVMPADFAGRSGSIDYNDVLPSLQLKYAIDKRQSLRAAWYKAISRPGYFEIIPYQIQGEYYNEGGNVNLNRTRAQNIDLRYEYLSGVADQFLLGGFYKKLTDPIEYSVIRTGVNGGTQVLTPNNFGTATNFGGEAVITKYFWRRFGISANYTYTHSRITTDKNYYFRDNSGQITNKLIPQTRPLQGQADHIGNLSLLFKDPNTGTDIQLAYVYTGRRIVQVSPYYGLDYWQRPFGQVSFSFEQRLAKRFSFYGKVNNLTNSPAKVEIRQPNPFLSGNAKLPLQSDPNNIVVQNDYYKTTILFGIRYKW